jgi:hypothetical protein
LAAWREPEAGRQRQQSGEKMSGATSIDVLVGHESTLFSVRSIYYPKSELERKRMEHYCRICKRERPNEQFSGKGHKIHVCKRCTSKPKSERRAIEDKDDIFGFMHQSHISEKNVARLEQMVKSENPQVASLAAIVVEVAKVTAHKKRRLKILAHKHPELLRKLEETGLVFAHTWDWVPTEVFCPSELGRNRILSKRGTNGIFYTRGPGNSSSVRSRGLDIPF